MPVGTRLGQINANISPDLLSGLNVAIEVRNEGERFAVLDTHIAMLLSVPGKERVEVARGYQYQPENMAELGRAHDTYFHYRVPLDPWRFHQIEQIRAGRMLNFKVEWIASCVNLDKNTPDRKHLSGPLSIDRGRWVDEFIPGLGYGNTEVWEVRFPTAHLDASLAHERELLRRAMADYDKGEYEDAYSDCRKMVENLENRRKELDLDKIIGKEEWGRAQHYLSIAIHAENEIKRRIIRADAEFAISLTRAIYKRVADGLAAPEDKK
jgi:hypothetical protein